MVNYKKYENGLRLIVNSMDAMMSVSVGFLVGAGSCLEDANNNGISQIGRASCRERVSDLV